MTAHRFTDRLQTACAADWLACRDHRFVVELRAGTLPDAAMARYLVQDHRFLDSFLTLLGAAIASADTFAARLRLGRFVGTVAGEENTYFERAFAALGVSESERRRQPDAAATAGFAALMRTTAEARSYALALTVLVVAEWLYLDWATAAPGPLPTSFVHAEWITLHANPDFAAFVAFLRTELDRVGPAHEAMCRDLFTRAVALKRAFFDDALTAIAS